MSTVITEEPAAGIDVEKPLQKSFIEAQFPVSKLSKESYKERKANYSQTLTGLGKWWGRKPLILVRATILGLLMPATDDPERDRETFLKILTMDADGLFRRKTKSIPLSEIWERLTTRERVEWFDETADERGLTRIAEGKKPKAQTRASSTLTGVRRRLRRGAEREELQRLVFDRLSYDEKLAYCDRPEQIAGPDAETWKAINSHLGTRAASLPELVRELGERKFGRVPRVGDAFCGGGSVPFEAARVGCEAFGSDLNPVAALLTWAALNIVGGGAQVAEEVREAQRKVYEAVDRQVCEWGIEHHEEGYRADAYLYCNETRCPECGWMVPLAPSWVIGEKTRTVARLVPVGAEKRYEIEIEMDASAEAMRHAKAAGTVRDSELRCPHKCNSTSITMIRGDRRTTDGTKYGLRLWENRDVAPRPDDVFQERLYCIRWVETFLNARGEEQTRRFYRAPDANDHERERRVQGLLNERFDDWQAKGYIPSRRIELGDKTDEPIRTRGWANWHHLFNPRQLLVHGKFLEEAFGHNASIPAYVSVLLGIGRCADWDSKLCRWDSSAANEKVAQTFSNQALNTLSTYAGKSSTALRNSWFLSLPLVSENASVFVQVGDARRINLPCDVWLTDPPYADAINYHELSEFFLAWYDRSLHKLFPSWYADSKRALAITGQDEDFRRSMVECYRNLAARMPDDGQQVVMFTHQDAGVWADLALILWASGLRVTAAWCIATETDSAMREGNYVQGTVLLVLRKQKSTATAFSDELIPQVEAEVKAQLDHMLQLDDRDDPNFGDTDYQLAAYAAALRVLTQYRNIEDFDIARELARPRRRGEVSPIVEIINQAVRVACDYLVPAGFSSFIWKTLTPIERFYLKGLDLEAHAEYRSGAYQELARGFGVRDYRPLISTGAANQTLLKTANEFGTRALGGELSDGFASTLTRHALFGVREAVRTDDAQSGLNYLRGALPKTYWSERKNLIEILRYLATMSIKSPRWKTEAERAGVLAGALENDSV